MAYLGYNNPGYRKHMAEVNKKKTAEIKRKANFRRACVNTVVICSVLALVVILAYVAFMIAVMR